MTDAKKDECDRQGNYLFISQVHQIHHQQGGGSNAADGLPADGSAATTQRPGLGHSTHIDGPAAGGSILQQRGVNSTAGGIELNQGQLKIVDAMIKQHVGSVYHGLKRELRQVRAPAPGSPETSGRAQGTVRFGSDMRADSYA